MNEYSMMHGIDWTGQDVAGWVITEKYDGVRAYWDGSTLWTRGGNAIAVPASWRDELPATSIDAELFAGYGKQRQAVSAARYGRFTDDMRLMVFDAPGVRGDYAARLSSVITGRAAQAVKVTMAESTAHALQLMRRARVPWVGAVGCLGVWVSGCLVPGCWVLGAGGDHSRNSGYGG